MTRLPLTVIGGYLGAGKTTLINQLLTETTGQRLAVLVNDFGKINIDAALLKSAREDTIELTNGCVCCAMTGDLFFAIGDMLDRMPRPDHLIVEASGIADPSKIAAVALAEPDLRYAGILTVVDGLNLPEFLKDPTIADQVRGQIRCADMVAVSKTPATDDAIGAVLRETGLARWFSVEDRAALHAFLFDAPLVINPSAVGAAHPSYVQWSQADPNDLTRAEIDRRLAARPAGLLRFKAILPAPEQAYWEVHVVGKQMSVSRRPADGPTGLVAIGVAGAVTAEELARWWQEA